MKPIYLTWIFVVSFGLCFAKTKSVRAPKDPSYSLAKRKYESGDYIRSLELFDKASKQTDDKLIQLRSYYYQGLIFFELGYYYSSYLAFEKVLSSDSLINGKDVLEKSIKNSILLSDNLGFITRLGKVISKINKSSIPVTVLGEVNYVLGQYYFESNDMEKTLSYLKSVPPGSQFYIKSLITLGIISTQQKNYNQAQFFFQKAVQLTLGHPKERPLQELARLDLARTYYSMGKIDESIQTYAQFLSSSPYWLTLLLEASWPLMKVHDTTVSLGNLETVLSPFYQDNLVGEAYILRTTILFSLCKFEEMRQTLDQFFKIYEPIYSDLKKDEVNIKNNSINYFLFSKNGKGISKPFINYLKRDLGVQSKFKLYTLLENEKKKLLRFKRIDYFNNLISSINETQNDVASKEGDVIQAIHKKKIKEIEEQREQANYLKVEIITGEKDMVESEKNLRKQVVDVETTISSNYVYWPFYGEFWEDELGAYVYTTESSCLN